MRSRGGDRILDLWSVDERLRGVRQKHKICVLFGPPTDKNRERNECCCEKFIQISPFCGFGILKFCLRAEGEADSDFAAKKFCFCDGFAIRERDYDARQGCS